MVGNEITVSMPKISTLTAYVHTGTPLNFLHEQELTLMDPLRRAYRYIQKVTEEGGSP